MKAGGCQWVAANSGNHPTAAALPNGMYLLWKINMDSGTRYTAIELANWFFSISIRKEDLKQFVLTWNRPQYSFPVLPGAMLFLLPSVLTSSKKTRTSWKCCICYTPPLMESLDHVISETMDPSRIATGV